MPSPADSPAPETVQAFIARWRQSGGHERAAAQLFLTELCDLLGLPHADPPSKHNHENRYCFERAVPHTESDGSKSTRFIDCYKRGCFVLETKQGINPDETKEEKEQLRLKLDDLQHVSTSQGHGKRGSNAWDTAIEKAKNQAEGYIRDLPPEEGRPPDSADFVMYWWQKAAELLRDGKAQRFGFITTNSIHQTFNRRVIEPHLANEKKPLHLAYAIPDHPWVDSASGAAVRIAMTVATAGQGEGKLETVIAEHELPNGERGVTLETRSGLVVPNLKIGANLSSCGSLVGNAELSNRGFCLFGSGFIVSNKTSQSLTRSSVSDASQVVFDYRNGKDLTNKPRFVRVIDAFGHSTKDLQEKHPGVYQHLLTHVKPERDSNKRESRKKFWWLFGEPNKKLRAQLHGLPRYIATVETSKHRFFTFLDQSILPDNMLVNIATDDAYFLGTLSSIIHITWALAAGGTLEDRPRYNKTRCFETFPFPDLEEGELKNRIREFGERLDRHRKDRQAEHTDLPMTGMYNILEKLRKEESLTEKEKKIHSQGLVSTLKDIHDQIDDAVLQAYGWSDLATNVPLADRLARGDEDLEQELLTRLVDLNHQRAAEEKRGLIRYLRPEYQNPSYKSEATQQPEQSDFAIPTPDAAPASKAKLNWPKTTREQIAVLKQLLPATGPHAATLSAHFGRKAPARESQIQDLLHTLSDLGQL